MTVPSIFLSFVLLWSVASAKPVGSDSTFTLPIFRRSDPIDEATIRTLVRQDLQRLDARADNLKARWNMSDDMSPVVTDSKGLLRAPVLIGDPPQQFDLVISIGSSWSWIRSSLNKTYQQSGSSTPYPATFTSRYITGLATGNTYNDLLTFGSGLGVYHHFGVSEELQPIFSDGVLGLGPSKRHRPPLLNPPETDVIPTVLNNLYSQAKIKAPIFGIWFAPYNSSLLPPASTQVGEITWGECDPKLAETISWVDAAKAYDRGFWGFELGITYSDGEELLPLTSGILDTAMSDDTGRFLKIKKDQYSQLQSLFFTIGDKIYEYEPYAQIFSPSPDSDPDSGEYYYLNLIPMPQVITFNGLKVDLILGYQWLNRFYTCFDAAEKKIALSYTSLS